MGYNCNIEVGQSARIPLSYIENPAPEFASVPNGLTTSAGSTMRIPISATAADGCEPITYSNEVIPRGASLNAQTGLVTWKPDSSQVGENHFAITATDAFGRESTIHFAVTVYGSTTGSKPSTDNNSSVENSGNAGEGTTSGGGGGGGGGGAAPTDKTDDTTNTGNEETDINDTPDASGETETLRFTDLSNYAWAKGAINALAADEIIKGTTASTFSPANNITRADFALLLVRAFELESANTENFADVSASDYFASELAIARNTGIVNGIGDNKYAPLGTITRQDMMVMVYRAIEKLGVELGENAEPKYPDFDTVAPYARDAVSALIGEGLVNGKSGRIAPTDYTTRAEVAVLIKRILDYISE